MTRHTLTVIVLAGAIADKKAETIDEDVECLCKLFIIVGRDLDVVPGGRVLLPSSA